VLQGFFFVKHPSEERERSEQSFCISHTHPKSSALYPGFTLNRSPF